jgi:hypothetical protein
MANGTGSGIVLNSIFTESQAEELKKKFIENKKLDRLLKNIIEILNKNKEKINFPGENFSYSLDKDLVTFRYGNSPLANFDQKKVWFNFEKSIENKEIARVLSDRKTKIIWGARRIFNKFPDEKKYSPQEKVVHLKDIEKTVQKLEAIIDTSTKKISPEKEE